MDNFDLRNYLSNNPLLKENQEIKKTKKWDYEVITSEITTTPRPQDPFPSSNHDGGTMEIKDLKDNQTYKIVYKWDEQKNDYEYKVSDLSKRDILIKAADEVINYNLEEGDKFNI